MAVVVLFAVLAKRKGRWLSIPLSQRGSMDPISASLAAKSKSLGLHHYRGACLEFGQGPETLELPWLRGGREEGDSVGAGLGKHRSWKGWGHGDGDGGLEEVGKVLWELG